MGTSVRPQADPFADLAAHDPFADLAIHQNTGDINLGTDDPQKPLLRPLTTAEAKATPPVPSPARSGGLPPIPQAQAEATYRGPAKANPHAHTLNIHDEPIQYLATKYLAQPAVENPVTTVVTPLVAPLAIYQAGKMAKDVVEYGAQKAAELSLSDHERALAEADPNRIPGERAAVEAGMLTAPLLLHGGAKAIDRATDVSGKMVESAVKDPALRAELQEPASAARDGLPPRPETAAGKALARAEEIANRADPFADLAPSGEESPSGVKFTDKRAASAMPSGLIAPEEANARPSTLVTPEPAPTGPILRPGEATPPPTPEPLLNRFGVPVNGEPGQTATGEYGARGIRRIPASELPLNQRPPVEPGPDAQTVSYGGRVLRRPGGAIEPPPQLEPEVQPPAPQLQTPPEAPVEPSPSATTYSTPEPLLKPIVSSNGTFEARPGVLKGVNAALNAGPTPMRRFTATFGPEDVTGPEAHAELPSEPRNVPADDLINKTTLDTDPNGSKALSAELDRLKEQGLDKQKVSFETQRRAAQDFADNLNIDRLTLDPAKYGRLSGAEIVGLKNVLTQNLNMMGELSTQLADEHLSTGEGELLSDRIDKLRDQNDALLSKIVKESSEKGRDLGFLRQLSNGTLDPDAWVVTAKRLAGDRVLDDATIAKIRKLARDAAEACGGA